MYSRERLSERPITLQAAVERAAKNLLGSLPAGATGATR
jgi:hypothetical protein